MKITRVLSVAVVIGQIGFGVAHAQAQLKTEIPAEFPPASFKGSQYVDSRGCVYIRAGIDGNVTWVPRMTRAREHICNAQPTFAQAPQPQPTQQTAAQKPVVLPPPADASKAAAPAPKPAARTVVQQQSKPAAAPAPRKTVQRVAQPAPRRVAVAPAPKKVRQVAVPASKVVAPRAPVARTAEAGCQWASPQSAVYLRGKGVRCGPQTVSPVSGAAASTAPRVRTASGQVVQITPHTRIVPLHVAKMQANAADVGRVPEGFRRVWDDDRLNPKRAHQTLAGKRAMDLRWTQDVPRRLIDINTGLDVTAFNPDLVYPYTSMQQQSIARAHGVVMPAPRAHVSTKDKAVTAKPTMSTRSAPKPLGTPASGKALRVAVNHRYVQVGRYPSDAAARTDAARLKRAGLSVRMGTLHSGGSKARVLLAGPYSSPQALGNALHAARKAGFSKAFTRK